MFIKKSGNQIQINIMCIYSARIYLNHYQMQNHCSNLELNFDNTQLESCITQPGNSNKLGIYFSQTFQ